MRFTNKQKQLLYYELAKFVKSGFGFEKACEVIAELPASPASHRIFCESIINSLKDKKTVGQAIEDIPLNISNLEINIISSGEKAGLLEQSFKHLEQHYRLAVETRAKILKGLAYPIVLLHFGAILGLVAVSFIGSWSPGAEQGAVTANLKKGLILIILVYASVVAVGIFFVWLYKHAKTSSTADRLLNWVPLLGKTRKNLAMARFCEVFQMGLLSGQKIDQCLEFAGGSSASGRLLIASLQGAEKAKLGGTLVSALESETGIFPADFVRSVGNAELAGVLDEDFSRWTEYYRISAVESVERLAEWAPRLFYWAVMLVVGFIIIKMALAYQGLILNWTEQLQ